ncbi:hypothetical protein PROFUN_09598 [Planoprotostelium fungivorum]|uniref:Homeobox domain-containing protein n=1 Tax=Planoprotostelium fungivorum TaxID=1890364 RepID=A0A2P6NGU8_9EUKA|nr:hypothetical protein PROFUN_09598 [Planoprotostelium fungivorum]
MRVKVGAVDEKFRNDTISHVNSFDLLASCEILHDVIHGDPIGVIKSDSSDVEAEDTIQLQENLREIANSRAEMTESIKDQPNLTTHRDEPSDYEDPTANADPASQSNEEDDHETPSHSHRPTKRRKTEPKRKFHSPETVRLLESLFRSDSAFTSEELDTIIRHTGLTTRQIKYWWTNKKRRRTKKDRETIKFEKTSPDGHRARSHLAPRRLAQYDTLWEAYHRDGRKDIPTAERSILSEQLSITVKQVRDWIWNHRKRSRCEWGGKCWRKRGVRSESEREVQGSEGESEEGERVREEERGVEGKEEERGVEGKEEERGVEGKEEEREGQEREEGVEREEERQEEEERAASEDDYSTEEDLDAIHLFTHEPTRKLLTPNQLRVLESHYDESTPFDDRSKSEISHLTGLTPTQIVNWRTNRKRRGPTRERRIEEETDEGTPFVPRQRGSPVDLFKEETFLPDGSYKKGYTFPKEMQVLLECWYRRSHTWGPEDRDKLKKLTGMNKLQLQNWKCNRGRRGINKSLLEAEGTQVYYAFYREGRMDIPEEERSVLADEMGVPLDDLEEWLRRKKLFVSERLGRGSYGEMMMNAFRPVSLTSLHGGARRFHFNRTTSTSNNSSSTKKMGFSQQPLLGGEDLHLSPSEKDEVLHKINSQWNRLKRVMPFFMVLTVCGCIGLILAAIILKNARLLIYLPGPAVGVLAYAFLSWLWMKIAAKHQAVAAQLFEEQYIGSWKFEPHTWRDFAKYLFQQKMKAMRILAILSVFVLAMGVIPFVVLAATAHNLSVGIIFCITMIGPLFAFTLLASLIGGLTLYPRYRSYSPIVHCCVLGRGSVYLLGNMYTLQPAAACSATMVYNLMSVTLEEKMIETNMTKILRFDTKTRVKDGESALTLEVPVPDQLVHNVSQWMFTLVEGYTDDVRNTIGEPAAKRETVPQAVSTVYVRENDITP